MRSWLGTACEVGQAGSPHRSHTCLVMRGKGVVCRVCGASSARGRCGLRKPCKPPEGRARQRVQEQLRVATLPPDLELELVSNASEEDAQPAAPEMAGSSGDVLSHAAHFQPSGFDSFVHAHVDSRFSEAPRVPRDCGFDDPDGGCVSESDM